eukprot:gene55893-76620_t
MNLSTYPPTSSPTDKILSPSSRTIWVQSKKEQYDTIFRNADRDVQESEASSLLEYPITLQNQLKPVQFPGNGKRFILGTSSSSRKKIIDALKWNYIQMSPDIDEKSIRCDNPLELPLLIAKAKADALLIRLRALNTNESSLLLTSDQIVLFDSQVREKPVDADEATFFLSSYSDTCVATVSAVVITEFPSGIQTSGVDVAKVHWKSISDEVVAKVV